MRMDKIFLISILLALLLPVAAPVFAQTAIPNPIEAVSFEAVINNIIDFIFKIAVVLVPLMIIIGGVMFLTAAGNLEKVNQAKRILIWTIIGFLIVLLSKGILAMLETILTKE